MRLKRILFILMALSAALVVAVYATLSSLSFEDLRDLVESETKALTGRDLTIAGPIDLRISLKPEIVLEDVSFANAPWGSRLSMVELKRFELQVALLPLLTGDIQVQRLTLIEPNILLETDEGGRGNWAMGAGDGSSGGDAPALPRFELVEIQDGTLAFRDESGDSPRQLDLTRLRVRATAPTGQRHLELEGRYQGTPFSLEGSVGSLATLLTGPFPIELTGTAGGAALRASGAVAQPATGQGLDLKVAAKGENLNQLAPFLGRDLPALGPYDLSARLAVAAETLRVSGLSVTLGESDLAGAFTVDLAGPRPLVEGAFSANLLDPADFQAAGTEAAGEPGQYVFTAEPIVPAGLETLDARVALKVARLRVERRLELSDLDLKLDLAAGRLTAKPLSAGLAGGALRGEALLDTAGATPQVTVKVRAEDLDYGALLARYEVSDRLSGTLDLDLDLHGQGDSARAVAATLSGRTEAISDGGRIDSALLKFIGSGLGDVLGPLTGEDGTARLNCMVSRFRIEDGLATSQDMVMDSDGFTVVGEGTVDLKTEGLDLRFDTATRSPSLASLAVPFHMTGTLAEPRVLPDPVAAAANVAKAAPSLLDATLDKLGALLSGSTDAPEDANACVAALEAAREGGGSVVDQAGEAVEGAAEAVGDAVKDATEKIKNLLGD